MLKELHVQNVALIENLTLNLGKGLNILSGETGAGKSIIIDSLNFVLGERADKSLIRNGASKAVVEGVFENVGDEVNRFLEDMGVEPDDVLVLRRTMTQDRNECRVNGSTVTLGMLKSIGEKLADIHGQHEHQSLLKVSTHVRLLDAYGGKNTEAAGRNLNAVLGKYRALTEEWKKIGDASSRERKLDVLKYQIDELKEADLKEGEEEALLAERKKFRNAEKILNAVRESEGLLNGGYESFSAVFAINKALNLIGQVSQFDDGLSAVADRLESAKIEVKDVADTLKAFLDDADFDDFAAEKVEKRLELVRQITRKYGGSVESAKDFLDNAEKEYDFLVNADERANELNAEIALTAADVVSAAVLLHELRVKNAKSFEEEINRQLRELGMPSARFSVGFASIEGKSADDCNNNGFDSVEFMISPNKGEPLKPLQKIASGGEMSRFMLALKNITARLDGIETMVFDEIDTGISGATAQVVAEKLYNIACDRQVIAVTHLPQLASMADLHYKIEKHETEDKTVTDVFLLDEKGELDEIARLIGGSSYSEHAIPHALEMKKHANAFKNGI